MGNDMQNVVLHTWAVEFDKLELELDTVEVHGRLALGLDKLALELYIV